MDRGAWQARVQGVEESDTTEQLTHTHTHTHTYTHTNIYVPVRTLHIHSSQSLCLCHHPHFRNVELCPGRQGRSTASSGTAGKPGKRQDLIQVVWLQREAIVKSMPDNQKFILLSYPLLHWEKAMAPHSSTLAWKIPWTEEPGGLHSMRSLRVGHD